MNEVAYFTDMQLVYMDYVQFKPKNLLEKYAKHKMKKKIYKVIHRIYDVRISSYLIDDFITNLLAREYDVQIEGVSVEIHPAPVKDKSLIIHIENKTVIVTIKGESNPYYISVVVNNSNTDINQLPKMEYYTGYIMYTGDDPRKNEVTEIVVDLLHDTFEAFLKACAEANDI